MKAAKIAERKPPPSDLLTKYRPLGLKAVLQPRCKSGRNRRTRRSRSVRLSSDLGSPSSRCRDLLPVLTGRRDKPRLHRSLLSG